MKAILHNRSLLLLGLAESISNIGNWVTVMAIYAIVVFHGDGGVAESSAVMLAGLGPMLIFSPVAGWLSDRFDRKWLMISSQVLSALPIIAIIVAGPGPLIYLFLALQTAFTTLMLPARQAVVPLLVPQSELARANALLQQTNSFVKIGGPILGGVIVGLLGAGHAMLLDVVSFTLAAVVLLWLPPLPPPRPAAKGAATTSSASEGDSPPRRPDSILGVLRHSAPLRLLFLSIFVAIVAIMGFDVLGSLYVRDVLLAQEGLFGLLIGLIGLGSLLSAGWLMLRRRPRNPWQDLAWGLLLLSGIPLLMAAGFWVGDPRLAKWLVAFALLLGGLGNGLVSVQVWTLLQALSPPARLGRMGGLFQSSIAAAQLTTILVTPWLVPARLSIGQYFALSAAILMLLALALFATWRGLPAAAAESAAAESFRRGSSLEADT